MSKPRILVVDDVPDWQKTILRLLADEGYEVITAGDREAALKAAKAHPFDLAVVDVRLDETDEENRTGLELADDLRNVIQDLPVIIITGYDTQDTIARAFKPDEMGRVLAVDFVPKTDAVELVNVVKKTLSEFSA